MIITLPARPPQLALRWPPLLVLLVLMAALLLRPAEPQPAALPAETPPLDRAPLGFVANAGQADPATSFEARGLGGTLSFSSDEVRLALPAAGATLLRLQFVAASATTELAGDRRLPGVVNVFHGADPARWRSGLPSYAELRYHGLYPGIDLLYVGGGARLKGTYTVAPGADPARIRWRYHGARAVALDGRTGALRIELGGAQPALREDAPIAWQTIDGRRAPVAIRYQQAADGSLGFALGPYDRAQPLTIDPTLDYSSYLGGSSGEAGHAIAVDAAGNVYLTGYTGSRDFPTAAPLQPAIPYESCGSDVFITKWRAGTTTPIYSTFLGGGDCDSGVAIAADAAGNAYVSGTTSSADFPTHNALQPGPSDSCTGSCPDTFVAKLSPDGQALLYSSYLGGDGQDTASAIAVDRAGNIYLTGTTLSDDFPTARPLQATRNGYAGEPFIAKISSDGQTLLYSTFLGGSGFEISYGLAVDRSGEAVVVGFTSSEDFPTTARALQRSGSRDAFVARLSPDGQTLRYSTFLGGSDDDRAHAVALDTAGNAYITGFTRSADFPTRNSLMPPGGMSNAFVAKLSPDGQALVYSTFLGGDDDQNGLFTEYEDESGNAIAVDAGGSAYVVGATNAGHFPTRRAVQPTLAGPNNCGEDHFIACADAFVAQISPAGSALVFSSYLGGSAEDIGAGVAVDQLGQVYLTGVTRSDDFTTVQTQYPPRSDDAFVARLSTRGELLPTLTHTRFIPLLLQPGSAGSER